LALFAYRNPVPIFAKKRYNFADFELGGVGIQ